MPGYPWFDPKKYKGEKGDPISIPPEGFCKIENLYVDPNTGKLVVVFDDKPIEK